MLFQQNGLAVFCDKRYSFRLSLLYIGRKAMSIFSIICRENFYSLYAKTPPITSLLCPGKQKIFIKDKFFVRKNFSSDRNFSSSKNFPPSKALHHVKEGVLYRCFQAPQDAQIKRLQALRAPGSGAYWISRTL